ncbi:hypothetical protein ABW19_dt0203942 [Dactylella cylindrospora]|nr:hypothetical protein ABW19_dt0203942 [Dactylella cylindrospora]
MAEESTPPGTARPMGGSLSTVPSPNLSSLPADIIYEICDHLSDQKDILQLRLVSKNVCLSLPSARLSAIHSKKTYFLCAESLEKLSRLSEQPELSAQVTHLCFDLGIPYVHLGSREDFIWIARGYKTSSKRKLKERYERHVREHFRKLPPKPKESGFQKLLRVLGKGDKGARYRRTILEFEIERWHRPIDMHNGDELPDRLFDLFERYMNRSSGKWLTEIQREALLVGSLEKLHNLKTIEFLFTNPRDFYSTSELIAKYRENDPALRELLPPYTGDADSYTGFWPWIGDCLYSPTPWEALSTAYPSVLYCAAQARRRIQEIRVGELAWTYPKIGIGILSFALGHAALNYADGEDIVRPIFQDWVRDNVEKFQYTFKNLKRLDVHLDQADEDIDKYGRIAISPLFQALVKNVEDLRLRKWPSSGRPANDRFVLPVDIELNNLRRLELGEMQLSLARLEPFILAHKATLREIVCGRKTFHSYISRAHFITFIKMVRTQMNLEALEISFIIRDVPDDPRLYLIAKVQTKGDWGDEGNCDFRLGLISVGIVAVGREKPSHRIRWITKDNWEEFIFAASTLGVDSDGADDTVGS